MAKKQSKNAHSGAAIKISDDVCASCKQPLYETDEAISERR